VRCCGHDLLSPISPAEGAADAALPDDLYDYARLPLRRPGRPAPNDRTTWTVRNDWPEHVPVTEAWFGDLFDEFSQSATELQEIAMTVPVRAALYQRVSTGRQADNDLSIPDQRRQAKAYCTARGLEIVADYVEPGLSATDDRRPEFQHMIDAATTMPPAFDAIVVHSFSRFFRDQFQLEFYVRRLAKSHRNLFLRRMRQEKNLVLRYRPP
jgi:Resolvase, N terminal domain